MTTRGESRGSVKWWAVELCRSLGESFDQELEGFLSLPQIPILANGDEATKRKMMIAHLARFCAEQSERLP